MLRALITTDLTLVKMYGRSRSVDVIALVVVVLSASCSTILTVIHLLFNLGTSFELDGVPCSFLEAHGSVKVLFALTHHGHGFNELLAGNLHDCSKSPGTETKADSGHVHAESDRSCSEELANSGVANHQELHVKLAEENDPEPEVLEWLVENVEVDLVLNWLGLIIKCALLNGWGINGHDIKDSAVDHVEEVHHDEALEHEGLV